MNLVGSAWDNEEDDEVVHKFSSRFISTLNRRSKEKGIDYPFVYINDADPTENPFKFYGQGKSLKKLRAIRDKYGMCISGRVWSPSSSPHILLCY